MIIRLRIKEILEEKGKSNYWLSQRLGMCYRNYHNIVTNQTSAIRFDTLERLCEILEAVLCGYFFLSLNRRTAIFTFCYCAFCHFICTASSSL